MGLSRRGLIIYNPTSGSRNAHADLLEARTWLQAQGWSIDLRITRGPGDASRLAHSAAEAELDAVLIAGGDGTLNEAVNALVETRTALGLLPCGTANVWARQLGMPLSYRALANASRLMNESRVHAIDVGRVTLNADAPQPVIRHFLLWSGLGLDAHVTRSVEPRPASFKRWGQIAYALAAVRASITYRGVTADLELDGRRVSEHAVMIVVGNAQLYAGYFYLAPGVRMDDGQLEVIVLRGEGFRATVGHFARMLLRRRERNPQKVAYRAREVRIATHGRCDVHVDAEPIGTTPATYTVVPQALRVLVPANAPASLFAS
jgi:YegS/Rv2252/BmrU family lipid kinase